MEHYKATGEKLLGREAKNQASQPTRPHGTARSKFKFTRTKKATTATELTRRLGTGTEFTSQSQRVRSAKNKEHLSYGGRATLRRCPFFMASPLSCLGLISKLEKTSKQTQDFVLHFIVFACLGEGEARASSVDAGLISKLEKTSKL